MSIKKKLLIFSCLAIFFISVAVFAELIGGIENKKQNKVHSTRYLSFAIADEFRHTSMDLTRLCRTYVSNGEQKYWDAYWDIVKWRSGKRPRPEYVNKELYRGKTKIQTEIMQELGFSESEFALLKEASHNSNALIATEDIRYREHSGVDFRGLMRVLMRTVILQQNTGGGSTISQQLAKNLFPRKKLSKMGLVLQKMKEWIIATRLEKSYTKNEILAMYLNTVPFGSHSYGVKSASRTFFNTTQDSLENSAEWKSQFEKFYGVSMTFSSLRPKGRYHLRSLESDQRYHVLFEWDYSKDFPDSTVDISQYPEMAARKARYEAHVLALGEDTESAARKARYKAYVNALREDGAKQSRIRGQSQ